MHKPEGASSLLQVGSSAAARTASLTLLPRRPWRGYAARRPSWRATARLDVERCGHELALAQADGRAAACCPTRIWAAAVLLRSA